MNSLNYNSNLNNVMCDDSVDIIGCINGKDNNITVKHFNNKSKILLFINGNNNKIEINESVFFANIQITIGNEYSIANNTIFRIGKNFHCGGAEFRLYNPKNKVIIGDNVMFSIDIKVVCGELPHLIFDKNTSKYLDTSDGVYFGDHVWVGEDVLFTKHVTVPSNCIVGSRAVVTRRFSETNCVIAGNPAKVVKSDVVWVHFPALLTDDLRAVFSSYYDDSMSY